MTATLDAATPSAVVAEPEQRRFTGRWLGPLAVTALGGWLRMQDLGQPHALVFDETYYAKDAASLLLFGVERSTVADADDLILASDGTLDPAWFTDSPSFVLHPPVGKWVIAVGQHFFGATPLGWRVAVAVLGTLSILVLARAVLRMTGSALWGTAAGLLLAVDGLAIVMSRTAVLDGVLAFFVVSAFALLLVDRDWARSGRTPGSWWRPWRLLAAACLGLACGVKWSGIWYVAAFLVLTVLWEAARRRREGRKWLPALLSDASVTALTLLPVIVLVYVASWAGWFASDSGYDREWVEGTGPVAALQSLWHYHGVMWSSAVGITSDHSYQSSAFGWLVQARPTSFFYTGDGLTCASGDCAQAVTALGNPLIWWAGTLALLVQAWRWAARRDWRSGAVLLGVLAGWAPWLAYPERTIFTFYAVVFAPFVIAALTLTLAAIAHPPDLLRAGRASPTRWAGGPQLASTSSTNEQDDGTGVGTGAEPEWRVRVVLVALFVLACVVFAWFFYPLWSGQVIDFTDWGQRIWLPSWR